MRGVDLSTELKGSRLDSYDLRFVCVEMKGRWIESRREDRRLNLILLHMHLHAVAKLPLTLSLSLTLSLTHSNGSQSYSFLYRYIF